MKVQTTVIIMLNGDDKPVTHALDIQIVVPKGADLKETAAKLMDAFQTAIDEYQRVK